MVKATVSTPTYPTVASKADGLIVQVGTPGITPQRARTIIRTTIKDHLPGKWRTFVLNLSGREGEGLSLTGD
jgi:hypothetical protein